MYIRVLRISKTNFFTNSIKISQLGHIQIILTKIEQLFYDLLLNLKKDSKKYNKKNMPHFF
jgi:hypothetical protein